MSYDETVGGNNHWSTSNLERPYQASLSDHDMTRTIIVDPAIKSQSGHHLGVATVLSSAAHSLGHKAVWLAHKKLDRVLVPDFVDFVPAFSSTIYEHQTGVIGRALKPLIGDRKVLRKGLRERAWEVELRRRLPLSALLGDRHAELIRALTSQNLMPTDRLIVPTADSQTVDMLASWCLNRPRADHPFVHVRTCWSDWNMPFSNYNGRVSKAVARLVSVARHVTLSSETEAGARLLASLTGLNVDVCPHPIDVRPFQNAQCRPIGKPLLIGWLGEPRVEKGSQILPDIIRQVLCAKQFNQVKFLVQGSGRDSRRSREFDLELADFGEAIERLPVAVSSESYLVALNRSDILLLPYDPKAYPVSRGSAVAVEALLAAKPMVAMHNTFPATLIDSGNGVAGSSPESLAAGILQIVADYEHFRSRALKLREQAFKTYDHVATYRRMI